MTAPPTDNRRLMRAIITVCDAHESPVLALVGANRWQVVSATGEPLGNEAKTPVLAWESAAKGVTVRAVEEATK